jgi:hypothetical protein
VSQCDGVFVPVTSMPPQREFSPLVRCEEVVAGMPDPPTIESGRTQAAYLPARDKVIMPARSAFESAEAYYQTAFHELAHNADLRIMLCCGASLVAGRRSPDVGVCLRGIICTTPPAWQWTRQGAEVLEQCSKGFLASRERRDAVLRLPGGALIYAALECSCSTNFQCFA